MADLTKLLRGAHPFLSDPGEWLVAGHGLHGEALERVPIQGAAVVRHQGGKIVNEGTMTVVSAEPVSFTSRYEIVPTADANVFTFFQENPSVGDLRGKVVAADDRLVTSYTSGDGTLVGMEVLHRMGEARYAVTGALTGVTGGGGLLSLWKFDMVRPAPPAAGEGVGEG